VSREVEGCEVEVAHIVRLVRRSCSALAQALQVPGLAFAFGIWLFVTHTRSTAGPLLALTESMDGEGAAACVPRAARAPSRCPLYLVPLGACFAFYPHALLPAP
jgi:hypothetical protein